MFIKGGRGGGVWQFYRSKTDNVVDTVLVFLCQGDIERHRYVRYTQQASVILALPLTRGTDSKVLTSH